MLGHMSQLDGLYMLKTLLTLLRIHSECRFECLHCEKFELTLDLDLI